MPACDRVEAVQSCVLDSAGRAGRWSRSKPQVKPSSIAAVTSADCPPDADSSRSTRHIIYTIGSWRVSREMYLRQLSRLGVQLLIDVRGNPRAGRQEDLWRGRDLTHALQADGIRYEYLGDTLGEDQVEMEDKENLRRKLKGLLASCPPGPVCLLGHMHEPHKCHRLKLCNHLPQSCTVVHLMWEDHCNVRELSHAEAKSKQIAAVDYFYTHQAREEKQRLAEQQAALPKLVPSGSEVASVASGGRWRAEERRRQHSLNSQIQTTETPDASFNQVVLDARSLADAAAKLPCARWESLSTTQWEELLRDGKSYRLLLPWDTELLWYPKFLDDGMAEELEANIQDHVTMYHPTYRFQTPSGVTEEKMIRKGQAKICDDFSFSVQYSSRENEKKLYEVKRFEPWSKHLLRLVEGASETVFNAIWFNQYRDGTVTIHWHADSDEGLGPNPVIGSVSLGATRDFSFKSKRAWPGSGSVGSGIVHLTFPLFHGSLIVMGRNSQTHWLHAVPAMEGSCRPRTNLTFRFYAHEDLALLGKDDTNQEVLSQDNEAQDGERETRESSHICLRNSKLVRETRPIKHDASAEGVPSFQSPTRIRLCPKLACEDVRGREAPRPFLVDMPSNPGITIGELRLNLSDSVQPIQKLLVRSADVVTMPAGSLKDHDETLCVLPDEEELSAVLKRVKLDSDGLVTLLFQPPHLEQRGDMERQPAVRTAPSEAWWKSYRCDSPGPASLLRREFESSLPQAYAPPLGRQALVPTKDGGDWVREVIQSLSGIQRKSKGRGQLARQVFHQTSEFVALYSGHPKSTIHMLLAPKRLLDFCAIGAAESSLLQRLASYASLLVEQLSPAYPHLRFAAGMRSRRGRVCQFHVHILSMDLVTQHPEDMSRQHYQDFVSGPACFLPLGTLVATLESGKGLPPHLAEASAKGLSCHRCGQFFGDAMLQLTHHLKICEEWHSSTLPDSWGSSGFQTKVRVAPIAKMDQDVCRQVEEVTLTEIALLEEMGFGRYGHDALRAALIAEGSVERAVEVLGQPAFDQLKT